jgi:hypothetical protein
MRFITRWIESVVARIAAPVIDRQVEIARSSLADRLHLISLDFHEALDAKAESFSLDDVARCIPLSQVVEHIDIDTVIDGVSDRVDTDSIAEKAAENVSIDAEDVVKHLDFSASDVAREMEIDYRDLAYEVDYSCLKDYLDMDELAGHLSGGDVADSLDMDKLAGKIDYRALAFALIEVASEQAARAKAQPNA